MLEIGEQRIRAARMLEAVYEARDEMRDLGARAGDPSRGAIDEAWRHARRRERKELLRRIADLRDERLHDDDGALEALVALRAARAARHRGSHASLEIGRRLGARERVADVLERGERARGNPGMRGEILIEVARHLRKSARQRREGRGDAIGRCSSSTPDDAELALPAARALERLYIAVGAHEKLRDMLRIADPARGERGRAARSSKAGSATCARGCSATRTARSRRGNRVSKRTPGDAAGPRRARPSVRADRRATASSCKVLEARRDRAEPGPAERREFMRRAAETSARKLDAASEAIDTWRAIVEEFGAER